MHGPRLFLSFFALAYIIPLTIIATMYILILRFLRSRRRQSMISFSHSSTSGPGSERRRISYPSRVFLAVVVVFGACWLPLHGHLLLVYMGRQPHARWYAVFRVICHVLAYSNSCVNPFIYHYVSADFRRSLAAVLAPLCRRRGARLGRAVTSSAIELRTTHPVDSGFIAGARSAVLRIEAADDQDDSCVGSMSLVAVHNTALQVQIDTVSPASNDDAIESARSKLRVGKPSYSA